jgi:selenium-binding protein 1
MMPRLLPDQSFYPSPAMAMKAAPERFGYVALLNPDPTAKDAMAVLDLDPSSPRYGAQIASVTMPGAGDELHHFGWNACSSCHADAHKSRRYLIVPGFGSSRIHIIDVADERAPRLHKVIEAEEVKEKTNLSAPHTVHCLADGNVLISMLGDAAGNAPGGFLLLDEKFNIAGRWETGDDFWYQPRHNVMVSSELAAPNTYMPSFNLDDVAAGKYGSRVYFWDWERREIAQTFELGEQGLVPLEVRFYHNPESTHGFVGATLSSTMWHWHKPNGRWEIEQVIAIPPIEVEGWPFPVP